MFRCDDRNVGSRQQEYLEVEVSAAAAIDQPEDSSSDMMLLTIASHHQQISPQFSGLYVDYCVFDLIIWIIFCNIGIIGVTTSDGLNAII